MRISDWSSDVCSSDLFVTVAIAAIAVFAGLTLASANEQVSSLVGETHRQDARAAADAAAQGYENAGGWADADLSSTVAVAARGQAEVTVFDADGQDLAAPAPAPYSATAAPTARQRAV